MASYTVTTLLVIVFLIPFLSGTSDTTDTGTCEYDLDLSSNKVKITCQGSPSAVNVFANNAVLDVNGDNNQNNFGENTYDKHFLSVNKQPFGFMPGSSNSETRNPETLNRKQPGEELQFQPLERLTFPDPGFQNFEEPVAFQMDGEEMASKHAEFFTEAIWNARQRMHTARRNLSSCTASIRNLSAQLDQGDSILRTDTDNLRRTNNLVTDLKEGIIAVLRNQYNFMSNAILTRSYELQKLASAMKSLVDVTADGLNSTLTAHRIVTDEVSLLNTYLRRLRKRVSREVRRVENVPRQEVNKGMEGQCPKQISAIGKGTSKIMQWATGSYMVQSANPSDRRSVFIMADTGPTSQLREYHTALEVDYNLVGKYFTLPFSCSGIGHVVYRRHFYCHETDTNLIVKYHLKRMEIVSKLALPGAKFGNSQRYMSGANTDIDLAVDELGLWAIYVTDLSAGDIVIAKIDHKKMEIERTWNTTYPKKQVGNAFVICGVLYATNYSDTPIFIKYMYNTELNSEHVLKEGALPFANSALLGLSDRTQKASDEKSSNSVMLSYDFSTSTLYSWNNGWLESFPVYFKETG